MKLLLVEDDMSIGAPLQRSFIEAGVLCRWVLDGAEGLELAGSQQFDVIVLDVLLPGIDGLELLRTIRTRGISTPVILLTALGTVEQRVSGLGSGADDFLVKPFEFAELMARVKAVTRRVMQRPSPIVEVGDVRLDLSVRLVVRGGVEIELTPTEMSILEYLMRFAGQVVTRKMICRHVWDVDWDSTTNVVDVNINRLRSKLDRSFDQPLIHTVRGRGYVFRST